MPVPPSSSPSLTPAPRLPLLRTQISDSVRALILDGTLARGEVIDEEGIRQWMGVSSTPVKEAIVMLLDEGIVERCPGRHTRVIDPTEEDAAELRGMLAAVLPGLVAWGLPQVDEAERNDLAALLDGPDATEAAVSFLVAFLGSIPNGAVKMLFASRATWIRYVLRTRPETLACDGAALGALGAAVAAGDGAGAAAAMVAVVRGVAGE